MLPKSKLYCNLHLMASESFPTVSLYSLILLHNLRDTEPSDISMLELCGLSGGELGEPNIHGLLADLLPIENS